MSSIKKLYPPDFTIKRLITVIIVKFSESK